jgi:hypothetical protein
MGGQGTWRPLPCGHRQGCGVERAATDDDEIKVINSDISEVRCIYDRRMETT